MLCCSLIVYIYRGMHYRNNPEVRRRNYVSASDIYYRQYLEIRMRRLQIALWHETVFSWTRHPNTVRALPGEQIVFSP